MSKFATELNSTVPHLAPSHLDQKATRLLLIQAWHATDIATMTTRMPV
jgi:hypothetical protein